ncbi:MAG: DUF4321 domain-containing protein [Clostridia bacterium]|nr:DUF4321 domain-containing protein [Clostridia bacterium]
MRRNTNVLVLIIFLLVGLVVGSFLGDLLKGTINLFSHSKTIGFDPFTLDLIFIQLTLGFEFTINLATVIGLLIVLIIYRNIR